MSYTSKRKQNEIERKSFEDLSQPIPQKANVEPVIEPVVELVEESVILDMYMPSAGPKVGQQDKPTRIPKPKKVDPNHKKRWHAIICRINEIDRTIGAEVGVWQGETSEKVLAGRNHTRMYLVDRWGPPVEGDSYDTGGSKISKRPENEHTAAYHVFLNRITPFEDRATIIRTDTVKGSIAINDAELDYCFIDGDHSFIGLLRDLIAYIPKVKVGGWIGGHDWNEKWDVEDAVLTLFDPKRITRDVNSTWFMTVEEGDIGIVESYASSLNPEQVAEFRIESLGYGLPIVTSGYLRVEDDNAVEVETVTSTSQAENVQNVPNPDLDAIGYGPNDESESK